jgi:hypothetical protein
MLQPRISRRRPESGVNVALAVEVIADCVSVTVTVEGRKVVVRGADGMNGGVGERITGKDEGETTAGETTNGILIPEHAARKKRVMMARMIFITIASKKNIVSENQENGH